jgi:hypothetical protein
MAEDRTMRRVWGFTFVEMLVVIGVLLLLLFVCLPLMLPKLAINREDARRSACGNNLGNMMKCCLLYSDALPNLGMFPMYGADPNANGLKSLNLLYSGYIKDHRVFSCTIGKTPTAGIPAFTGDQTTMTSWMTPQHTKYGYDPGHNPTHATGGVIADFSDDPTKNSSNHGPNRPGQNVAIGAGSVEWWDKPNELYTNEGMTEELESFIIQ